MKISVCALLFSSLCAVPSFAAPSAAQNTMTAPGDILATLKTSHPRLLASATSWNDIKTRRLQDPLLDAYLKRTEIEARALLDVPPIPYKKDGKRLLHVSRVVLRRVLLLSLQYRLSADLSFLERAKAEMLNVAAFADWNPSHFLDTAEMTTAVALGYDWLYDQLDEPTRQTLRRAIIDKGLKPGLTNSFVRAENNWNEVCLCGMSLGALAVAEVEPDLARQTLQRTRDFNHNGLKVYAPDGVYPEGAMYWGYGTTFEAILLDALHSALGTDWGLSQSPGFLKSTEALFQMQGPTGAFFNFSDGVERPGLEGATFWFAHFLNRPELARIERDHLQKISASTKPSDPLTEEDRTLPLAALWWPQTATQTKPLPLNWYGCGLNPVAAFRSAWNDPNAMFLALKSGKASNSHGHMDAGSFVFESDGVRWASDLGMQNYLSLESKGVDLWNNKQDSQRWRVFRLGPFTHNTLTINGQLHQVNGDATITHFSSGENAGAVVYLSPVFAGQATHVTRGFSFRSGKDAFIRDELEGLKAGDAVRWAMLTNAQISLSPDANVATLTQNGKTLRLKLTSLTPARFEMTSAQPPQNDYDQSNPGFQLLTVNFTAPPDGTLAWSVELYPGSSRESNVNPLTTTPLNKWPMPPT